MFHGGVLLHSAGATIDSSTLRIDGVQLSSFIEDPEATLRVAYTSQGKPYFIDVPFPR